MPTRATTVWKVTYDSTWKMEDAEDWEKRKTASVLAQSGQQAIDHARAWALIQREPPTDESAEAVCIGFDLIGLDVEANIDIFVEDERE